MSQAQSQTPPTSPSTAPRGRFAGRRTGNRPPRKPREEAPWIPQTILGKKVAAGEITSIEEILSKGLRIQEAGIVKKLLPDLKTEVIDVGIIQKNDSKRSVYSL